MDRAEFEHTIRTAGTVLNETEVLVIGSQAIHASTLNIPEIAERSMEGDFAAFDDPLERKADLLDGTVGEASMFHDMFGYYIQGVTRSTAVLPQGWKDRLIRYETPNTNGVVAWCLEVHDLWISKAIAWRSKDLAFCVALVEEDLVDTVTLARRLDKVRNLEPQQRSRVSELISSLSGSD
ncbi:MAG: hypothetical protein KTV45_13050 [Acidimicrobiia bacterium]|nr:hypothetical protein [Acidimicrobiia bacterium]